MLPASGLSVLNFLIGQLGLEESHGLLHLLELCLQLLWSVGFGGVPWLVASAGVVSATVVELQKNGWPSLPFAQ
jgi:hypothetical protein